MRNKQLDALHELDQVMANRLKRAPFWVRRAKVIDLERIHEEPLARFFEVHEKDQPQFGKFLRYNRYKKLSFTFGSGNSLREMGLVVLYGTIALLLEKSQAVGGINQNPIDAFHLEAVQECAILLLKSAIGVTGWIDQVRGQTVEFSYQDEDGKVLYAEGSRERFWRLSDLSEGVIFRIQTWEENGYGKCDFFPLMEPAIHKGPGDRQKMISRLQSAMGDSRLLDIDRPVPPTDWSNEGDVARYYAKLQKRYGKIEDKD